MIWNVPDHCLKRRLIEDDILSNPRQMQMYLPWLDPSYKKNWFGHTVHNTVQTNKKLLRTSSAVMCTHTVQPNCSPCEVETVSPPRLAGARGPGRGQLTP